MAFKPVCHEENLWKGEKIGLVVDGKKVLLVNVEGVVAAFDDRCAHMGWPLSQGRLVGQELICGLHQWRYDACTGAGLNPRGVALRSYAVRVSGGDILVDLDGA